MEVVFDSEFKKAFNKRIIFSSKLLSKFQERLKLFCINTRDPILRDHQLVGVMRHYRSFSVTGDIRVIYRVIDDNTVAFVDIGTHNQVYGG